MRDAIANNKKIVMSAHSRGTILTDEAWKNVFAELRDKHKSDPDVIAAGDRAAQEMAQVDPLSASAARSVAISEAARQKAAKDLNDHVTVLNAGNAVWAPNPLQDGRRVVTTWHGMPVDVISVPVGTNPLDHLQNAPVDITSEKPDALARAKTIVQETTGKPGTDSDLSTKSHHTYGHWYVGKVSDLACGK